MPFEIWMPSGHNSLSAENQIPITELQVCINEKNSAPLDLGAESRTTKTVRDNKLQIIHKSSQKRVYIFDLGFQGLMGRSQLFQLLEKFTLAEYLSWYPLLNVINKDLQSEENKKTILVRPRVVYENQLILQRKAWFVPKEILPLKKSQESDWAYFERINEWRLENGMPDEVFIFVTQHGETENIKPEVIKKLGLGRDDYKPQYVSFKNPFLVSLFGRLITKVPNRLRIEEMLPNSEQLLKIENNRHVTEFVVQWYEKKN
jgi:hypothetical protein